MIRFILHCFLLTLQPRIFNIDPVVEDFSNLISLAGITALLVPSLRFRNLNKPCEEDKDCFGNRKCCQMYFEKFCCNPEKYVKVEPKLTM
mgnify:CR=1 FL=1